MPATATESKLVGMPTMNHCGRCGLPLPVGQTVDHLPDMCIRLLAHELRTLKDVAANTSHELAQLRKSLGK